MKKLLIITILCLLVLSVSATSALACDPTPTPPPNGTGTIKVFKFNDVNGNGVQDPGENGIEGWKIRIYWWGDLSMVAEGYTDANGWVTFTDLPALTRYKVWEEAVECWEPTTPNLSSYTWDGGHYYVLTSLPKDTTIEVEFGNWDICTPPPPSNPGTGTPGYWKNHPEAWPVEEITIGGATYNRDDAIALMGPEKGDKTLTLFRALVAAKLNVMIDNDDSCVWETIAAADSWMMGHEAGSGVKAGGKDSPWRDAEPLYEVLDDYNNGLLCAPHRD